MNKSSYMNRALQRKDPRFASILGKLGYNDRAMQTETTVAPKVTPVPKADQDLTALRQEYQEVVGKKPGPSWDADTLRAKIAEAQKPAEPVDQSADDDEDEL